MPETPKTPAIEIVREGFATWAIILALAAGLAIGAAAFYLFTERVTEGEASDA